MVACPDVEELERLLLGQITSPAADDLEQHVSACTHCLDSLGQLNKEDPLVAALKKVRHTAAESSTVVDALIPWLKRLRPRDATQALPAGDAHMPEAHEQSILDYLDPAQQEDELGRLGPYRVLRLLGLGGMGMVFRAEDPRLQRQVALKVIKPELVKRHDMRERFVREARAAAAVEHDHIVTIYEVEEYKGVSCLTMPLLCGETLEDYLRHEDRPLPVDAILQIGRDIAQGLSAAHARGLVHRDIKPANVFLSVASSASAVVKGELSASELAMGCELLVTGCCVKILDFGLAHSVRDAVEGAEAAIVGTPAYMAPEQARGLATDARADLFSLGCVLYRMATGTIPFTGRDFCETLIKRATEKPASPVELNGELPPPLVVLIEQLLQKDPAQRPASAQDVADRLGALYDQRHRPRLSRRRWWAATAALILAAVGLTAWLLPRPQPPGPSEPGDVVFHYDEADQRLVLVNGEGEHVLDLAKERHASLPPGIYSLRLATPRPGRWLMPETVEVRSGECSTVDLRLVGQISQHEFHSLTVWCVALAPVPGALLALSGGNDQAVVAWNAGAAENPRILGQQESPVLSLAIAPDGKWAASGGGKKHRDPKKADLNLYLWNIVTGAPVATLPRHESFLTSLAFTPDGKHLLVGGMDGSLVLWDLGARTPVRRFHGHDTARVNALACSADGKRAAAAAEDGQVIVWDIESGHVLQRLLGHGSSATGTAFLPGDDKIVSAGTDGSLRVWVVQSGACKVSKTAEPIQCLAVSSDGSRALTGSHGGDKGWVRLWDLETGKELVAFAGHQKRVLSVAFSVDGRHAVSGGADRTVRLWELPK